ncbi:MAG TPA: indolepyruvate ferredoxin oxidoreductase family protein [Myxococcales bacterium]|nr:indolepyruvate ferredoxin oxidoreductase family protein [Myxococcales bacterium]
MIRGFRESTVRLDDKYLLEEGTIYLSGIQALVRLTLDQHRADRRRGLKTATFVSGYRGSPLGGLDVAFERAAKIALQHEVRFVNGVNEELAATAVFGSQLASALPAAKYDGVLGMWYGKGPGVDRSGDIFKHANFAGVGKNGGVLALAGDDPACKSSTIPSQSEPSFWAAGFPVLYPGSVQEVLDLGLHGYALSRCSGLWVGMKCATDVCDEAGTAEVSPGRVSPVVPHLEIGGRPFAASFDPRLFAPFSLEMEASLHNARLEMARRYAAANGLNRIVARGEGDRIGIVAAGKTWFDLRQSLRDLGLGVEALRAAGIRLLKIGMLHPLEPGIVGEFAEGLEEILVVEEKRPFLELLFRDVLYGAPRRPRIVGKQDEAGNPLVPVYGELEPDSIAPLVASRLAGRPLPAAVRARLDALDAARKRPAPLSVPRTAFFCSGCPHNTSTVVPEGSIAGGGIGCHTMAIRMDRSVVGVTQMGGEGAQWVGAAPFSGMPHMFQNLGDGTLFHSGMLAIKAAVSSGVNLTYKVLYNSAVAMTGGQHAAGSLPVPALVKQLLAEGVREVAVLSDEPEKYTRAELGGASLHHRDDLDAVQRRLREIPGVTALVYDQECAAEKRRLRKRGKRPDPPMRVFIDPLVCEGCGDCGVKSNCLSVQPLETELGRKTRIHQSSCNKDYSCLKGDCPSFLSAVPISGEGSAPGRKRRAPPMDAPLPEPSRKPACGDGYSIFLMGIGGTGVVTVDSIVGTAALLDGKRVRSLDQTGLSQKGGPVVSHLRLFDGEPEVGSRIGMACADLYLGLDLLVSTAPQNLARADPERTAAVVSTSKVPTGQMVTQVGSAFPAVGELTRALDRAARSSLYLDSLRLSEALFGDHMPAGLLLLGAAYQAGLVPLRAESIERAIELNEVSVEVNRLAFRWGRRWVADQAAVEEAARPEAPVLGLAPKPPAELLALLDQAGLAGELRRLLEIRFPDLVAYQNLAYARSYLDVVREVASIEQERTPGRTEIAEAAARNLYKLMAYKDEYEVARLLLRGSADPEIRERFPGGARVYWHLHPPFLRALGLKRKLKLGSWSRPLLVLLRSLRRLRGSALDPFGRAEVRKTERALIGEYRDLLLRSLANLSPATYDTVAQIAALPDLVRGYESIKLRNVVLFRERARALQDSAERNATVSPLSARAAQV